VAQNYTIRGKTNLNIVLKVVKDKKNDGGVEKSVIINKHFSKQKVTSSQARLLAF
jgi:hypothetical protein